MRPAQRIEGERRRIRARLTSDDLGAGTLPPHLELIDRGGAEGIAGRQQNALPVLAVEVGELADGGGLAGAVDADDQHHKRLVCRVDGERSGHGLQDRGHFIGEGAAQLFLGDRGIVPRLGQPTGDLGRRGDTEIGDDQELLELIYRGGVEAAACEDAGDALAQPVR